MAKRRTAKQKAADKKNGERLSRLNKAKKSTRRAKGKAAWPKQDNAKWLKASQKKRTKPKARGGKLSKASITRLSKATSRLPLDILKYRAMKVANLLVKEAHAAGIDIDQIPAYVPKKRR